ncbi:MAG TPA: hypothetical protein VIL29_10490 [Pseudothermotoga sp.]
MSKRSLKKSDMIEFLVEEYGYERKELEKKTRNELLEIMEELEKESSEEMEMIRRQLNRKKIFEIPPETVIPVMNNTYGRFAHVSDRFGNYVFSEYGQIEEIPMAELHRINHRNRRVLTDPMLIILDEQAIKQLHLESVYEKVFTDPKDIDRLLSKDKETIRKTLERLTDGMKQVIAKVVYERFKNQEFEDLGKIRMIEEVCKVNILDS